MPTHAEVVSRNVYAEAEGLYGQLKSRLGPDADLHYEVLYGPPVDRPPIFFLAFQPGGGHSAISRAGADLPAPTVDPPWPLTSEYGDEKSYQYRFVQKLRKAFPIDLLAHCTGCNALFVRAPSVAQYNGSLSAELRGEISDGCRPLVLKLIRAMHPQLLVVLGFKTMALFDGKARVVLHGQTRPLVKEGVVDGRRALAMLHPTGGHRPPLSDSELGQIGKFVMEDLHSGRPESE